MKKIKDGNTYNVSAPVYYAETQAEVDEIASIAPAGTIIEFNSNSFKLLVVKSDHTYNEV